MRRSASEIIHELEIRVAHLEKKAFLGKIKSSIKDVYTKLLREIPLERYRNKYLKEVFGRLNKAMKRHGKRGGVFSNIDLSPHPDGGLEINYTVNGSKRSFIAGEVRDLYRRQNWHDGDEIPILESIIGELEGDPLFFPLLKGETEGLYDQLKDTKFLLRAEKKFWSAFEKTSSAGAKILKALVKIGLGVALFKLIMAAFILIGGGSALLGVILTAFVGLAVFAWDKATTSVPNPSGWLNRSAKKVDDEEVLENFLELLEQEGIVRTARRRNKRQASHHGYYELGRVEPKKSDFREALKLVSKMEKMIKDVRQVEHIWNTLTDGEKKAYRVDVEAVLKLRNEIGEIVIRELGNPFVEIWFDIGHLIKGSYIQDPKDKLRTLKALSNFKSEIRKQM